MMTMWPNHELRTGHRAPVAFRTSRLRAFANQS